MIDKLRAIFISMAVILYYGQWTLCGARHRPHDLVIYTSKTNALTVSFDLEKPAYGSVDANVLETRLRMFRALISFTVIILDISTLSQVVPQAIRVHEKWAWHNFHRWRYLMAAKLNIY